MDLLGEVKEGGGNTWQGEAEVENTRKMVLGSAKACSGEKIEKN